MLKNQIPKGWLDEEIESRKYPIMVCTTQEELDSVGLALDFSFSRRRFDEELMGIRLFETPGFTDSWGLKTFSISADREQMLQESRTLYRVPISSSDIFFFSEIKRYAPISKEDFLSIFD